MDTVNPKFGPPIEEFVHRLPRRIVFRTFYIHDGKALCAGIDEDDKQFALYNDSISNRFDAIDKKTISVLDGKPYLIGKRDGKVWVAHGKQEFGPYDKILEFLVENDKLFFTALVDGKTVVGYHDTAYEPFERIDNLCFLDGSVKFIGVNDQEKHLVCGEFKYGPFSKIKNLTVVGSVPCFMALHQKKWYVLFGEQTYGPFVEIEYLRVVDGQPLFVTRNDNTTKYVHHGENIGPPFKEVSNLSINNETYIYSGLKSKREAFVIFRDKQYGPYEKISHLAVYQGNPLYCAKIKNRRKVFLGNIEVGDFASIGHLQADGDEIIIVAKTKKNVFQIFCGDYESEEWQEIIDIIFKDNILAYTARRDNKWFVFFRDTTLGPYEGVSELNIVNEKLLFVKKSDEAKVVYYDGSCYGPYKRPQGIQIIDGKPFFFAKTNNWQSMPIVVYGNEVTPPLHSVVGARVTYEGKLLVLARTADSIKRYVYYDGQKGDEFNYIDFDHIKTRNGKLLYRAWPHDNQGEVCVIYGDVKYGPYEQLGVAFVRGKTLIIIAKEGNKVLFIIDDKVREWNTDSVKSISNLNLDDDKPIYKVHSGGKFFVVWGDVIGQPYDYIYRVKSFNGIPLYEAMNGSNSVVILGQTQVSPAYEEIRKLTADDSQIRFFAKISDELHRVTVPFIS